jgi:hypothetical protein
VTDEGLPEGSPHFAVSFGGLRDSAAGSLLEAFLTSYAVAELTSWDFAEIRELSSQSETETVVARVG